MKGGDDDDEEDEDEDKDEEEEQGRIHGSISRVRVGRGSIVVGQGQ